MSTHRTGVTQTTTDSSCARELRGKTKYIRDDDMSYPSDSGSLKTTTTPLYPFGKPLWMWVVTLFAGALALSDGYVTIPLLYAVLMLYRIRGPSMTSDSQTPDESEAVKRIGNLNLSDVLKESCVKTQKLIEACEAKTPSPRPWRITPCTEYEPLAIIAADKKLICGWPISKEDAQLIVEAVNARF
jgi:hypothetical protein